MNSYQRLPGSSSSGCNAGSDAGTPGGEFILRPEAFGGLVYDVAALGYFFVDQLQTRLLRTHATGRTEKGGETGTNGAPLESASDLSGGRFAPTLRQLEQGAHLSLRDAPGPLPVDALAAPVRVYLEITTRCNARCRYCLNDAGPRRQGEMTTPELLQLVECCGRDGVLEIRLTGGEPTLHDDFFALARAVRACGMVLSVNSNLHIDDRLLDRLIELRPDLVITSLDADEAAHCANRGPDYRAVAERIGQLRAAGLDVRANCMLNRQTLPALADFIDRLAALGCGFCFIVTRPVGRAAATYSPPPLPDLLAAMRTIDARRRAWPGIYFSTSFDVVMDHELCIGGVELTGCNAMQKSFNVNSDGAILPCAFLYELDPGRFVLGNVRSEHYSLLRVWRESPLVRRLRRQSAAANQRCIRCPSFHRDCLGSCILMQIWSELTDRPDPYCRRSCDGAGEVER